MVAPSQAEEYARKLALLEGDDFESEVVVAFQQTDHGFQRIPRKPGGDGGLDGLSHGYTVAYCFYGPEPVREPGLSDAQRRKQMRKKIVGKFTADLQRLHEVEAQGKARLCAKPNGVLAGILGKPPSTKIGAIKLIASWFEDNRILGDMKKALEKVQGHSECNFVQKGCDLAVWGPRDIASNVTISQRTLARVDYPGLLAAINAAANGANHRPPDDAEEFDLKFDDLAQRLPGRAKLVETMRETFREAWATSIGLDEHLAGDLPTVHLAYESARKSAALDATMASAKAGADPVGVIDESRSKLLERMRKLIDGGLPEDACDQLARAETGRLIGECPLDWRLDDDD